ncbi:hypothetical protein SBOR_7732 [Sclerotinia borealis F-4128]|uniref:Uncharacterized protein n=1 Tax=Sclerotinia borealis (strain F-4128) TaxID=1432307 RepID=W9C546_SCLBF|nr:hypothetical protein SBOR_7732 [Sclerotinia borealis F-4128]
MWGSEQMGGRGKLLKHDAIQVPTQDIDKLIYRKSEFFVDLGNKFRVVIVHSKKAYAGQKNREIVLFNGIEENIEKAKDAIKERLLVDFEVIRRQSSYPRTLRRRLW